MMASPPPPQPMAGPSNGGLDSQQADQEPKDELDGLSISTFKSRPIENTRSVATTINSQISHLETHINTIEIQIRTIAEVGAAVEDSRMSGDEDSEEQCNKMMADLEKEVLRLLDSANCLKIEKDVIVDLHQRLVLGEKLDNLSKTFSSKVEQLQEAYMAKSNLAKHRKNPLYCEFKQAAWDVNHDEACPPMSHFLTRDDEEEDSDDEEFEVGGATQSFKCPLTLLPYVDAHTSTVCHHSYSGAPIKEHILAAGVGYRGGQAEAQCPHTGCNKMVKLSTIKPDPALQKKCNMALRRQELRQEEREDARYGDAELIE